MDNSRIMVVLGERQWTLGAIHLACAVARSNGSEVVLLHMVPVRHPLLLGTDLGYVDFSFEEQCGVHEYASIAACYSVCFEVCVFQYATYIPALVQAADQFEAAVVFAALPRRLMPLWHRIEVWWLKKALSRRHRSLYLLEQPDDAVAWTPLITFAPDSARALPRNHPEPTPCKPAPVGKTPPPSQVARVFPTEQAYDISGHSTARTIRH